MGPGRFLTISASDTLVQNLIESAGAVNAEAPSRSATWLDLEDVLTLDPDVILLMPQATQSDPSNLYADPRWRTVKSVKQHRVYAVPSGLLFEMNGMMQHALLVRWLATILHTGLVPGCLPDSIKQTVREELNVDLSPAQIDQALMTDKNKTSDGYEKMIQCGP
jgi:iron complex transport system substrate-binding protein